MKPNKYFFAALLLAAIISCSKKESAQTPVARLDNQTLALEEIRAHIDPSQEPSQMQIQQYIQRWLTEESLYREAVERGLDRTDEINQKVNDVHRQLSINALLEKEVYFQQPSGFSQQDITRFYNAHMKEFNIMYDAALVSYALFKNRDAATEFRNTVLKGTPWKSAVNHKESSIIARIDSSYQTQATLIPAELWRVAANTSNRELSFPIHTNNGYYILVVWKFFKQGQTAEISQVEQEIRDRLTVEKRRELFNRLIQNLRAKHAIEVFIPMASDSGKLKTQE